MALIAVKHNIEVAHRLYASKGKCENIHGHSMWVTAKFDGSINENGMLAYTEPGDMYESSHEEVMEFGAVKSTFRGYLDGTFDHHLLLNSDDPFASGIWIQDQEEMLDLPGLVRFEGDPTTENIARTVYGWMEEIYPNIVEVEVWETSVNMASYSGE